MPFVWLAVFLMPVNCLQPSNQDINAPIQNIRVDPRRGELSWDLHGNVGEVFCNKSRYRFKAKNNNTACQFHAFSSCMVTNYTIRITKGPSFSTIIRYPTEEGTPGTAAQNLTCRIHDKDFLQCRWGVGWAAPGDVQYHLYLKKDRLPSEVKCPHYTKDPQGRHVACHFNISRFENGFYQIMVNGTSKASRVSCTEIFKYLKDIEVLSPPNITGWCNKSYSFMEWKTPSRLTYDLSYELQIEKSTGPKHVETSVTARRGRARAFGGLRCSSSRGRWARCCPPRSSADDGVGHGEGVPRGVRGGGSAGGGETLKPRGDLARGSCH
nr:interleukin-3 receptor subunit alpha isoform X5 [Dasypus novemcinctus]